MTSHVLVEISSRTAAGGSDYTARTDFVDWCLHNIQAVQSYLSPVVDSGEYVFHVDEKFREHIVRTGGTTNF